MIAQYFVKYNGHQYVPFLTRAQSALSHSCLDGKIHKKDPFFYKFQNRKGEQFHSTRDIDKPEQMKQENPKV
jgi:hypothetical protein